MLLAHEFIADSDVPELQSLLAHNGFTMPKADKETILYFLAQLADSSKVAKAVVERCHLQYRFQPGDLVYFPDFTSTVGTKVGHFAFVDSLALGGISSTSPLPLLGLVQMTTFECVIPACKPDNFDPREYELVSYSFHIDTDRTLTATVTRVAHEMAAAIARGGVPYLGLCKLARTVGACVGDDAAVVEKARKLFNTYSLESLPKELYCTSLVLFAYSFAMISADPTGALLAVALPFNYKSCWPHKLAHSLPAAYWVRK